jgi:hypothetical protein
LAQPRQRRQPAAEQDQMAADQPHRTQAAAAAAPMPTPAPEPATAPMAVQEGGDCDAGSLASTAAWAGLV